VLRIRWMLWRILHKTHVADRIIWIRGGESGPVLWGCCCPLKYSTHLGGLIGNASASKFC
jgi:hypothetical protein